MIFDGTLSYLFNTGNNSGLIKNNINQVYMGDCTILCRFKPDIEKMTKEMPEIGFLQLRMDCLRKKSLTTSSTCSVCWWSYMSLGHFDAL